MLVSMELLPGMPRALGPLETAKKMMDDVAQKFIDYEIACDSGDTSADTLHTLYKEYLTARDAAREYVMANITVLALRQQLLQLLP